MKNDTALLVIDVQVSMFSSLVNTSVFEWDRVFGNISLLLQKARSRDIPIIFIQHTDNNDPEYVEGTRTWKLYPGLQVSEKEKVIRKCTWDSFHMTSLQETLQRSGIKKLVIAGMQTEFCVDTTCRRAFSMGYESILVKDAHSTFDGSVLSAGQIISHHNNVLGGRFVTLKPAVDIEF